MAVAWNNRGLAYLYKKEYEKGAENFSKALEID